MKPVIIILSIVFFLIGIYFTGYSIDKLENKYRLKLIFGILSLMIYTLLYTLFVVSYSKKEIKLSEFEKKIEIRTKNINSIEITRDTCFIFISKK